MNKMKKLIAAGVLSAAMCSSVTAYALPGVTGIVTVGPITGETAAEDTTETTEGAAEETAAEETKETVSERASEDDGAAVEERAEYVSLYWDVAVTTLDDSDDYINVRAEATTDSDVVGKMYGVRSAVIHETVETENGTWYKITSGNVEGYIKASLVVTGDDILDFALEYGRMYAKVQTDGLRVRAEASTDSEVLYNVYSDSVYTVLSEEKNGFVKIKIDDDDLDEAITGYVDASYVNVYPKFKKAITIEEEQEAIEEAERQAAEEAAARKAAFRESIVDTALEYVGYPYVYGGYSLTGGIDCSGFTKAIMAKFGISLTRSSRSQANDGYRISLDDVQPGDLVFYANGGSIYHVAMYIGGGKIVHAINESKGIGVSSMYWTTPYCAVNVID